VLSFTKLVEGVGRVEAIKIFIVLLFLAQRGKITLWQREDELYITVSKTLEEKS